MTDDRAPHQATRRTEGIRTSGRSARIVDEVLRVALEEVGRAGYEAMRMEDVAARSGVNKTTIYRRWPTKAALVAAAIRHFAAPPQPPETGSLRSDLLSLLQVMSARAESPLGCGVVRMLQAERSHPEVDAFLRAIRAEHVAARRLVVQAAIARGELPAGTDPDLVTELVFSPVFRRIQMGARPVDEDFIHASVDVVLAGARTGAAVRKAKTTRRPRARA